MKLLYTQKSLFNEYRFPVMKYHRAIIFKGELKYMLQSLCKISRTTHNVKTLFLDKMLMLIIITVTVEKSFIQSYINHTNNTRLFIIKIRVLRVVKFKRRRGEIGKIHKKGLKMEKNLPSTALKMMILQWELRWAYVQNLLLQFYPSASHNPYRVEIAL